ncbi:MAG: DUF4142 domain-containing protein [Mucilaginibacter sp.]|nr:DUF4142 domain-containing protein [Mucilaginibacter sp.]
MKNFTKLILGTIMITAAACSGSGSKSASDTDTTKSAMSNSTDAAIDSNKKELALKDSTELKDDAKFVVTAANGGMLEVTLGKLAQQKASSAAVKEFGMMMVTDHSKANDELKALAGSKVITIPAILSNDKQKDVEDMSKLSGAEFDQKYIDYMVKDHKEDIDEFKKEASDGKDAEIKAFASKHVPILQHHLEAAEKAQATVKK